MKLLKTKVVMALILLSSVFTVALSQEIPVECQLIDTTVQIDMSKNEFRNATAADNSNWVSVDADKISTADKIRHFCIVHEILPNQFAKLVSDEHEFTVTYIYITNLWKTQTEPSGAKRTAILKVLNYDCQTIKSKL